MVIESHKMEEKLLEIIIKMKVQIQYLEDRRKWTTIPLGSYKNNAAIQETWVRSWGIWRRRQPLSAYSYPGQKNMWKIASQTQLWQNFLLEDWGLGIRRYNLEQGEGEQGRAWRNYEGMTNREMWRLLRFLGTTKTRLKTWAIFNINKPLKNSSY